MLSRHLVYDQAEGTCSEKTRRWPLKESNLLRTTTLNSATGLQPAMWKRSLGPRGQSRTDVLLVPNQAGQPLPYTRMIAPPSKRSFEPKRAEALANAVLERCDEAAGGVPQNRTEISGFSVRGSTN